MELTNGQRRVALLCGAVIFTLFATGDLQAETANDLICRGCVDARDIRNNAVTTNKIKNGAVTGRKIRNKSVRAIKLAPDAKPAGAEFGALADVDLTQSNAVVTTLDITAPVAGYVFLTAGGSANFIPVNPAASTYVQCGLTTGTTVPGDFVTVRGDSDSTNSFTYIGQTRIFEVATGTTTFNWVCRAGTNPGPKLDNHNIQALFVPNRY